ncbi:DUF2326 domain-containing protein [Aeromonas veronii]|uniref:DUF2326 domain-containing protein n=1 Tax=Aeromonas veronii TaxID=654 RepID=UPI002B4A61A0|nr:DUF2326 domain-containing protein [Aeromonas veronii]
MQLIELNVYDNGELIRNIPFRDGINIITDDGDNGNQIGKSTALRVINFCLGSDGKSIWKDPENNKVNVEVESYITSGRITFELKIKLGSILHTIRRKCALVNKRLKYVSSIDDESINSQSAFVSAISQLFGHNAEKPTFKMIKSKFFRISKKTVNNAYKFLDIYSRDDDYILVYAYLFDFSELEKLKASFFLKKDIQILENRKNALLNGKNLLDFKERLAEIDLEIKDLREKAENYNIGFFQNKSIEALRQSREIGAALTEEITSIETKLLYSKKTIAVYESNITDVDSSAIESIYNEAKIFLPTISKKLSEVVQFHNSIFLKKADYVKEQVSILDLELKHKKQKLDEHLEKEKEIVSLLAKDGHLSGFILIDKEIESLAEIRGNVSYVVQEVSSILEDISNKETGLALLNKEINIGLETLNSNISAFNVFYERITHKTFKKYKNTFKANANDRGEVTFSIINEHLNTGDGVPRAGVFAFDVAMVEYMKGKRTNSIQFTMQDYLEAIDEYSLSALIEYVEQRKTQTIISILSDKISILKNPNKFIVLKLSKQNKFFKLI